MAVTGGYTLSAGTFDSTGNGTDPITFTADSVDQSGGSFTFTGSSTASAVMEVTDVYDFTGGVATIEPSPYDNDSYSAFGQLIVEAPGMSVLSETSASDGIYVAGDGALQLSGYASLNRYVTADIVVDGVLDVSNGTLIIGTVTNNGTFHLGVHGSTAGYDVVAIQGDFTQTGTGRLQFDDSTDRLNVTGLATLAGTLGYGGPAIYRVSGSN